MLRSDSHKDETPGHEKKKAALIRATLDSLMEDGAEGCSVRKISERAGVSIGLVNYHFETKHHLVAAAYRDLASTCLMGAIDKCNACDGDVRQQLSAFLEEIFGPHIMRRRVLRAWVVFWGLIETSSLVKAAHEDSNRAFWLFLEQKFNAMNEQRLVRPTPKLAAVGLTAMIDGLWLEWCLQSEHFSPIEAVRLCEIWLDAVWSESP